MSAALHVLPSSPTTKQRQTQAACDAYKAALSVLERASPPTSLQLAIAIGAHRALCDEMFRSDPTHGDEVHRVTSSVLMNQFTLRGGQHRGAVAS